MAVKHSARSGWARVTLPCRLRPCLLVRQAVAESFGLAPFACAPQGQVPPFRRRAQRQAQVIAERAHRRFDVAPG